MVSALALLLALTPPAPPSAPLNFSPPQISGQCRLLASSGRIVEATLRVIGRGAERSIRFDARADQALAGLNGLHRSGPTVVVGSDPDHVNATDAVMIGRTGSSDGQWLKLHYGRRLEDGGYLEVGAASLDYRQPLALGFCSLSRISSGATAQ